MIDSFSRNLELMDGFETNYMRLLYYDLPNQFTDTYKSYEYVRLCTILSGKKEVQINDGSKFTYNKDQFVLLPAHARVDMYMKEHTEALVLEMDNNLLKSVSEKVSFDFGADFTDTGFSQNLFVGDKQTTLKKGIDKIIYTYSGQESNKSFLIDLYAQEMVYELLKLKGAHSILSTDVKHPLNKVLEYIKTNLNKYMTIKELAWVASMSESSFAKQFKLLTGSTVNEYIRSLKLSKSKELLNTHTVTEVCYNLGYENISYFIKLFKTKYGLTPKQYKMAQRKDYYDEINS